VNRDGHVEVAKPYYSAPPEYLGRSVWARWDQRVVRLFNRRFEQIALHIRREPGRSNLVTPGLVPLSFPTASLPSPTEMAPLGSGAEAGTGDRRSRGGRLVVGPHRGRGGRHGSRPDGRGVYHVVDNHPSPVSRWLRASRDGSAPRPRLE